METTIQPTLASILRVELSPSGRRRLGAKTAFLVLWSGESKGRRTFRTQNEARNFCCHVLRLDSSRIMDESGI